MENILNQNVSLSNLHQNVVLNGKSLARHKLKVFSQAQFLNLCFFLTVYNSFAIGFKCKRQVFLVDNESIFSVLRDSTLRLQILGQGITKTSLGAPIVNAVLSPFLKASALQCLRKPSKQSLKHLFWKHDNKQRKCS